MRETLLLHLPEQSDAPYAWRLHGAESADRMGTGSLAQALDAAGHARLVLLAPSEKILLTDVDLPVRAQNKLLQAVPYALEDRLATDVDDLHFAVGSRQTDGKTPVAVVARAQLQDWLEPFAEFGVQPDMLLPDVLALPYVSGQISACVTDAGRCLIRSGEARGFVLPLDMLTVALSGDLDLPLNLSRQRDAPALPPGLSIAQSREIEAIVQALELPASADQRINLLQGSFTPRKATDQWLKAARLPAALAALWLITATLSLALGNHQAQAESERLRDQAQQLFAQSFPAITRIVDLRIQAEQELGRLRGSGASGGFLFLLSQTAPMLAKAKDLQLDGVQFRDGSLYLSLSGSDLQALERLRAQFTRNQSLALEVQSAQAGTDGVQIRLKVDQA